MRGRLKGKIFILRLVFAFGRVVWALGMLRRVRLGVTLSGEHKQEPNT